MKDVSVTLGKIEERFGEKLNNLNEKISHLDKLSFDASEEIKDKKDDKDNIINDLMEKANLNEEEKSKYREELAKKDEEIEVLRDNKRRVEREARLLRRKIHQLQDDREEMLLPLPSRGLLEDLLRTHDISDMPPKGIYNLHRLGIVDDDGVVDEISIKQILNKYYR